MTPATKRVPARVKDTRDLAPDVYRRLVARRAREILRADLGPLDDEDTRKQTETDIKKHFEKIHKNADFLPVRFLAEGARRARAVCRIATQDSLGTGSLVGKGVLMTNNHVLESAAAAAQSRAEFGFEAGQTAKVVAIQPSRLFITDPDLDFTLVGCDTRGIEDIEPLKLLRNPATITRNELANIIQHPAGRPKEVALHNNEVIRVKDKVIHYRTDTEPGSSGSPVFNNNWDLVALHHAGWTEGGGAVNEGIRLSAIVANLVSRGAAGTLLERESLTELLGSIDDSSPFLGFFDTSGLGDPGSLEVQVPDFTGTRTFADVGVWNIEHFNNQVSSQRIGAVADVLARLSMDVMGLTEVERGALDRLRNAMGSRGFSLGFEVSESAGSQDIAVMFDRETTRVQVRNDIATRNAQRLSARTATGGTAFPRRPMFAECRVGEQEGKLAHFILIVVHLKAFGDAQSRARRRLAAQMLAEIIENIRERENLPVVIGGDFNDRIDTSVLANLRESPDLFALTVDDAGTDAVSFVGDSHRSLIDHILVSRDVRLGEISGDDAAIVRLDKSVQSFAARVSDHVPVVFRMVYRDTPVDTTPATVATTRKKK